MALDTFETAFGDPLSAKDNKKIIIPSLEDQKKNRKKRAEKLEEKVNQKAIYKQILENVQKTHSNPIVAMTRASVTENSVATYTNHVNSIRRWQNGTSINDLCLFIINPKLAGKLANTTMSQVVSAWKFFNCHTSLEDCDSVTPGQIALVNRLLKSRRDLIPDLPNVKGAINKYKLAQLHAYYALALKNGRINQQQYHLLINASAMMYACALRIFQLRALTKDSFRFTADANDPNKIHGWVRVPRKGGKGELEEKQIHPDFVKFVREFLEINNTEGVFLFQSFGTYEPNCNYGKTKQSTTHVMESLMKDMNKEAADYWGWDEAQEFHATHCFRHGAAQDAFFAGGIFLVMLRTGHESQDVARSYAMFDAERNRYMVENMNRSNKAIKEYAEKLVEEAKNKAKAAIQNRDPSLVIPNRMTSMMPIDAMSSDQILTYVRNVNKNGVTLTARTREGTYVTEEQSEQKINLQPFPLQQNNQTVTETKTKIPIVTLPEVYTVQHEVLKDKQIIMMEFPREMPLPNRTMTYLEAMIKLEEFKRSDSLKLVDSDDASDEDD
jgi:hypothetical protein